MTTILQQAHTKAKEVAALAAQATLDKYFGGRDAGYCGFAWVTYHPVNKGNTRDGKAERRLIESIGFRKDYTGKTYQMWNPSGIGAQNVDCKEEGARAYARVMAAEAGLSLSVGTRLD